MRALTGQTQPTALAPPGAYRVKAKYIPKRGADKFFVLLEEGGYEQKAMFHESLFHLFHCGDKLTICDGPERRRNWLMVDRGAEMLVYPASVTAEVMTIALGYVSVPRRVGGGYWYISNLGEGNGWLHISYDVAREYFAGSQASVSVGGSYYGVLGINSDATPDEVRQSYRRLARLWHPDKSSAPNATSMMAVINEAYSVLFSEESRREYDLLVGRSPFLQADHSNPVRAWPGRGFGDLRCVCEDRGDTVLVKEILSFRPNRLVQEATIPINNVNFANFGVNLVLEESRERVWIDQDDLPFQSAEVLNKVKDSLPGTVSYKIESVQRGWWDRENGRAVTQWEVQSVTVQWSPDLLDSIEAYLVSHRYASALRAAVNAAKQRMSREGVLFSFEEIAQEHNVQASDIEGAFWRSEYKREFAEKLVSGTVDGVWGYSAEFLVFRLRNGVIALERPVFGAATYVFEEPTVGHPEGPQSIGALASVMQEINLLHLRRNKDMQKTLGYLGFAIHNELDSWWRKICNFVFAQECV